MTTTEATQPQRLTWDLSDAVERMRTKAGLDQGELAERVGVSRGSISNWERGRTAPHNFKTVQRVAIECGFDPDDPTLRELWDAVIAGYPVSAHLDQLALDLAA